jgi:Na+-transporting NADH:ubiquinone oxidoreductase subunit C
MKNNPFFAIFYMFILTAFFSSVLIGFARLTREKVQANQQIAFERALLEVFPEIKLTSNAGVHQIFIEHFEPAPSGYIFRREGLVKGYAVPVEGQGYWATIKAVIGIAEDRQTVTGMAIYEQNETPGLGARITEPDFCEAFNGLLLNDEGPPIDIRPAGTELGVDAVHAITGATQTCTRLEKLINDGLTQWKQQQKQQGVQ